MQKCFPDDGEINRFFFNGEFDVQPELGICFSRDFWNPYYVCTIISETLPSSEYGSGLYYLDNPSPVIRICMIS